MSNIPFIDTHCHLDLISGIQNLAAQEDAMGIKTITVTNSPMFYLPNVNLFRGSKNIRVALGMHPELSLQGKPNITMMLDLIADARFIGEIGLDGSTDFSGGYTTQISNLKLILTAVAKSEAKILTVHTRNAAKETIDLLHHHLSANDSKVILHWYSGSLPELTRALEYGYYFSVNHRMLKSKKSIELVKRIPIERILTETDAPFTFDAAIDNRLKSLSSTLTGLAEIFGLTEAQMKLSVYQNFKRLLE